MVFWSLFVVVGLGTFFQLKNGNSNFLFDKVFFTLAGIVGWLIVFLWFFTNHGVTEYNFNMGWALPVLFPIALFLKGDNTPLWVAKNIMFYGFILILVLLYWALIPFEINYSFIPIVLTLAVRTFFISWRLRKTLSTVES